MWSPPNPTIRRCHENIASSDANDADNDSESNEEIQGAPVRPRRIPPVENFQQRLVRNDRRQEESRQQVQAFYRHFEEFQNALNVFLRMMLEARGEEVPGEVPANPQPPLADQVAPEADQAEEPGDPQPPPADQVAAEV